MIDIQIVQLMLSCSVYWGLLKGLTTCTTVNVEPETCYTIGLALLAVSSKEGALYTSGT